MSRRLRRAWSASRFVTGRRYIALPTVLQKDELQDFCALDLPVFLYFCETWTLTSELKQRLNSFGTMSLRQIPGYRWHDYTSNDPLPREAGLRKVTCINQKHQLRLYGHVARHRAENLAHRILSCRVPGCWTMPKDRPRASVEVLSVVYGYGSNNLQHCWPMF